MAEVRNPFTYTPQYVYEHHVFVGNGPVKKPEMPVVPPASEDYYMFLATVYGESATIPQAWEAVADSMVLRAAKEGTTPGLVVADPGQYDAYTNPNILEKPVNRQIYHGHWQFLKAYAYLTQQKLNGRDPMILGEAKTLVAMDAKVRPVYALYTNQDVLLLPTVNADSPIQDETAPERYKTMNPKNPLKYYITNYYSHLYAKQSAGPTFLRHIPEGVSPDDYTVPVAQNDRKPLNTYVFTFYNIPHRYY